MKKSRIALFLAGFVIGGCVGTIPDSTREGEAGEGTDTSSSDGGGSSARDGSAADGATGDDTDAGGVGAGHPDGGVSGDDAGLVIGCHDAADCPGTEVCCGRKKDDDNSAYKSVSCETTCDSAYTYDHSIFCNPDDPHSCDGYVINPHCDPSDILPGLYVCVSN